VVRVVQVVRLLGNHLALLLKAFKRTKLMMPMRKMSWFMKRHIPKGRTKWMYQEKIKIAMGYPLLGRR